MPRVPLVVFLNTPCHMLQAADTNCLYSPVWMVCQTHREDECTWDRGEGGKQDKPLLYHLDTWKIEATKLSPCHQKPGRLIGGSCSEGDNIRCTLSDNHHLSGAVAVFTSYCAIYLPWMDINTELMSFNELGVT